MRNQVTCIGVVIGLALGAGCGENQDEWTEKGESTDERSKTWTIEANGMFKVDSLGFAYASTFDGESNVLRLDFYKSNKMNWVFDYSIDSIYSQWGNNELEFMDFDFDGLVDARLLVGSGARGNNEHYEVLLKKQETQRFSRLKGAYLPPNLIPNPLTRRIEAIRFYGKTMFEEHTIVADSLVLLKSTEVWTRGERTFRNYQNYDDSGSASSCYSDSVHDFGESVFSSEPLE